MKTSTRYAKRRRAGPATRCRKTMCSGVSIATSVSSGAGDCDSTTPMVSARRRFVRRGRLARAWLAQVAVAWLAPGDRAERVELELPEDPCTGECQARGEDRLVGRPSTSVE